MIQRLIDGEASDEERVETLGYLDGEAPHLWRDLALGYVEAQLVGEALRVRRAATVAVRPAAAGSGRRLWGLAAVLVVGIGIGWLMSTDSGHSPGTASHAPVSTQNGGAMDDGSGADGGVPNQLAQAHEHDATMRSLEKELSQRGFRPSRRTAYVSTDIGNGNRLVFPINHLSLRDASN